MYLFLVAAFICDRESVLKLNYVQKNNAVVLLMQYILLQAATMMLWLAC
jgi:hypothetical protein